MLILFIHNIFWLRTKHFCLFLESISWFCFIISTQIMMLNIFTNILETLW